MAGRIEDALSDFGGGHLQRDIEVRSRRLKMRKLVTTNSGIVWLIVCCSILRMARGLPDGGAVHKGRVRCRMICHEPNPNFGLLIKPTRSPKIKNGGPFIPAIEQ
jgi:hypothetical protein